MLPDELSNETYWNEYHRKPVEFWLPVLETIAARHLKGAGAWSRAQLGRNIVFLNETHVIKIGPPGWADNMPREAEALSAVGGKLPVRTPEPTAVGLFEHWEYLIVRKLPGRNLRELWETLVPDQRARLAERHGEIFAALQALPVPSNTRARLAFDWQEMIEEQQRVCEQEMRRAGVPERLVAAVPLYLRDAAPVLRDHAQEFVLLHGDLTHLNFLVEQQAKGWEITGLVDWGDAKIGPPAHEWISPAVHMYRGDPVSLAAFTRSAGMVSDWRECTARVLLYYSEDMGYILNHLPGGIDCEDWDCVGNILFSA